MSAKVHPVLIDIGVTIFIVTLLLGYLFPYSIFSFATPLVFVFIVFGLFANFLTLYVWFKTPKETQQLRATWNPGFKSLPIGKEVFRLAPPGGLLWFIYGILGLMALAGIIVLGLSTTEGPALAAVGGLLLVAPTLTFVLIYRGSKDEIIATSESLTFKTAMTNSTVPWAEILSVVEVTAYGIRSFRIFTTKRVFTYNDRYENYERLTKLINMAILIPSSPK
ncbi:MAG TPA: hypothetical protein V6D17_18680 [Candidatus Obscuribacterales bacterium]